MLKAGREADGDTASLAHRTHVAEQVSLHLFTILPLEHLPLEALRTHLLAFSESVHGTTMTPGAKGGGDGEGGLAGGDGGGLGGNGGLLGFGVFGGRVGGGGLIGGAGGEGGGMGGGRLFWQTVKSVEGQ